MVRSSRHLAVMILPLRPTTATFLRAVADRWVDAKEVASSVEEKTKAGWHASLPRGCECDARAEKRARATCGATWCKNCLVMDRTTLADQR